jgi:hypothetical protein
MERAGSVDIGRDGRRDDSVLSCVRNRNRRSEPFSIGARFVPFQPDLIALANLALNSGPRVHAALAITDLKTVDELMTLFNRDRGKPRLVLLLSPT